MSNPRSQESLAPEVRVAPSADDTATESETESEPVELGPGDSVSQRRLHTPPPPIPPIPPIQPPAQSSSQSASLFTPYNSNNATNRMNVDKPKPVTSHVSESESESESSDSELESSVASNTAPAAKRLRLTCTPAPRLHKLPTAQSATGPSSRRSPAQHSAAPHSATHVDQSHTGSTYAHASVTAEAHTMSRNQPLSLARGSNCTPRPPPTSDLMAVLAWAALMAKQAKESLVTANQGATPCNQSNEVYELLATVLQGVHSQLVVATESLPAEPKIGPSQSSLTPDHMEFVEDDAELRDARAAHASGKHTVCSLPSCLIYWC